MALALSDLLGHGIVLEGTGAAKFIDPSSSATIARDIAAMLDDPERIAEMKRAALGTAKRYEWSVQAKKFVDVFTATQEDPSETNG